jgi:HEAT repeat protein
VVLASLNDPDRPVRAAARSALILSKTYAETGVTDYAAVLRAAYTAGGQRTVAEVFELVYWGHEASVSLRDYCEILASLGMASSGNMEDLFFFLHERDIGDELTRCIECSDPAIAGLVLRGLVAGFERVQKVSRALLLPKSRMENPSPLVTSLVAASGRPEESVSTFAVMALSWFNTPAANRRLAEVLRTSDPATTKYLAKVLCQSDRFERLFMPVVLLNPSVGPALEMPSERLDRYPDNTQWYPSTSPPGEVQLALDSLAQILTTGSDEQVTVALSILGPKFARVAASVLAPAYPKLKLAHRSRILDLVKRAGAAPILGEAILREAAAFDSALLQKSIMALRHNPPANMANQMAVLLGEAVPSDAVTTIVGFLCESKYVTLPLRVAAVLNDETSLELAKYIPLLKFYSQPEAERHIVRLLSHGHELVRESALQAALKLRCEIPSSDLHRLLHDESEEVLRCALSALPMREVDAYFNELVAILKAGKCLSAAARALACCSDRSVPSVLLACATTLRQDSVLPESWRHSENEVKNFLLGNHETGSLPFVGYGQGDPLQVVFCLASWMIRHRHPVHVPGYKTGQVVARECVAMATSLLAITTREHSSIQVLLSDPDPRIVCDVVWIVGCAQATELSPLLWEQLWDCEPDPMRAFGGVPQFFQKSDSPELSFLDGFSTKPLECSLAWALAKCRGGRENPNYLPKSLQYRIPANAEAVMLAAICGGESAREGLVRWVESASPGVWNAALVCLAEQRDQHYERALVKALHGIDYGLVQEASSRLLEHYSEHGKRAVVDFITSIRESPDAFTVGQLHSLKGVSGALSNLDIDLDLVVSRLVRNSQSKDRIERSIAMELLRAVPPSWMVINRQQPRARAGVPTVGAVGTASIVHPLRGRRPSPDDLVRALLSEDPAQIDAAVQSLALGGDREHVEQVLQAEIPSQIQGKVAEAIAVLVPLADDSLKAAIEGPQSSGARVSMALTALGTVGDPKVVSLAVRCLLRGSHHIRRVAVSALSMCGDELAPILQREGSGAGQIASAVTESILDAMAGKAPKKSGAGVVLVGDNGAASSAEEFITRHIPCDEVLLHFHEHLREFALKLSLLAMANLGCILGMEFVLNSSIGLLPDVDDRGLLAAWSLTAPIHVAFLLLFGLPALTREERRMILPIAGFLSLIPLILSLPYLLVPSFITTIAPGSGVRRALFLYLGLKAGIWLLLCGLAFLGFKRLVDWFTRWCQARHIAALTSKERELSGDFFAMLGKPQLTAYGSLVVICGACALPSPVAFACTTITALSVVAWLSGTASLIATYDFSHGRRLEKVAILYHLPADERSHYFLKAEIERAHLALVHCFLLLRPYPRGRVVLIWLALFWVGVTNFVLHAWPIGVGELERLFVIGASSCGWATLLVVAVEVCIGIFRSFLCAAEERSLICLIWCGWNILLFGAGILCLGRAFLEFTPPEWRLVFETTGYLGFVASVCVWLAGTVAWFWLCLWRSLPWSVFLSLLAFLCFVVSLPSTILAVAAAAFPAGIVMAVASVGIGIILVEGKGEALVVAMKSAKSQGTA